MSTLRFGAMAPLLALTSIASAQSAFDEFPATLHLSLANPPAVAEGSPRVAPDSPQFFADNHPGYVGARGLITLEGVTGIYLNPTSGTLPRGQFTAQYCSAVLTQGGDEEIQHTAMFGYGVTDWFEAGLLVRVSDLNNDDQAIGAGGPYARLRLLKDESWWPEVSIGFMSRNGKDALMKQTVFITASKLFVLDEQGLFRSIRPHIGFRQIWQDSDVNEANGSIGYLANELEFPFDLYLVGEVSNKDDVFKHTPFSIGVQWRPANFVNFSVAGIQTGGEDRVSLYFGIGISFGF